LNISQKANRFTAYNITFYCKCNIPLSFIPNFLGFYREGWRERAQCNPGNRFQSWNIGAKSRQAYWGK